MANVHIVKAGENLTAIAKKYGTTVDILVKINGINNKNLIYVGQKITLPTVDPKPEPAPSGPDYEKIGKAVEKVVDKVENLPEFNDLVTLLRGV